MKFSDNKFVDRIVKTGLLSFALCAVFYAIACLFFGKIQLDSFSLSGSLLIILPVLFLSALWIIAFYLLDYELPEPVANVICAFFAGLFVQLAIGKLFDRLLIDTIFASSSLRWLFPVKTAMVSALSFFTAFWLFVGRLKEFDEEIDNLIYGGFTGTGIAAAICFSDFFRTSSLNLQFVIVGFITKVAICSTSCSLTALITSKSKKIWQYVISIVTIPLIFLSELFIKFLLRQNIVTSQHTAFEIIIPLIYIILIHAAMLIFVHRKSGENDKFLSDNFVLPVKKFAILAQSLIVLTLLTTVTLEIDSSRSQKISSPDSKITMRIPVSFEKSKAITMETLFNSNQKKKEVFVKKATPYSESLQLEIDFNPFVPSHLELEEIPFSPIKNCSIYVMPRHFERMRKWYQENGNQFSKDGAAKFREGIKNAEKNTGATGSINFQQNKMPSNSNYNLQSYSLLLKKDGIAISLEFSDKKNWRYINGVIKMIAKSLSEDNKTENKTEQGEN